MAEKRTHQVGVRVTDDELQRLEIRAKLMPGYVPVATYLRQRGLDVDTRPDPDPELLQALGRVTDALRDCRQALYPRARRDRAEALLLRLDAATDVLRELVSKIG